MKHLKIIGCIFLLVISVIWSLLERTVDGIRDIFFYTWSDTRSCYATFKKILREEE